MAANWRRRRYEIDIIARKGATLAFVEVKSNRTDKFGPPEMRVTLPKQRKIAAAASDYLSSSNDRFDEVRFDVIAVTWSRNEQPIVNHIESAFTTGD